MARAWVLAVAVGLAAGSLADMSAATAAPSALRAFLEVRLPGSDPRGVAVDASGTLWVADYNGSIIRITAGGRIRHFRGAHVTAPTVIAAATDGALWFDADDSRVGRIDPSGRTQTFPVPEGDLYGLAAAPNGSMWFTAFDHIDRITPQGRVTQVATVPGYLPLAQGLTAGAGGRLWFTVFEKPVLDRMTQSGSVEQFEISAEGVRIAEDGEGNAWVTTVRGAIESVPSDPTTPHEIFHVRGSPAAIVLGADGKIWFSGDCSAGRITPQRDIKTFALPLHSRCGADSGVSAANGYLWFSEPSRHSVIRVLPPGIPQPPCVSRRRFTIRLPGAPGIPASVRVGKRAAPVVAGSPRRAVIDLRDRPREVVHVVIRSRARNGRPITQRRSYRTCATTPP